MGRTGREPSWWEFVSAVLNEGLMDEHWKPVGCSIKKYFLTFDFSQILTLCSVCSLPYDFILKFENLAEEESYLRERLGLENVLKPRYWILTKYYQKYLQKNLSHVTSH